MSVDGEKIRLVRLALGWQQKDMADLLELQQPHLSDMEAGIRPVPEHIGTSLHFITGFSPRFFAEPIKADVPPGSDVWYRKHKNKYRKSEGSQAFCQIVFDTFEPLTAELKARPPKLSRLMECTPQEAATHVRNALGVRDGAPVENIAFLAESAGVRLVGIGKPELRPNVNQPSIEAIEKIAPDDDFKAFSFWSKDNVPVVFVRTDLPADDYNWAIAHDLIHLVMHSAYQGKIREAENEAQVGARELLLPSSVLKQSFGGSHSVTRLCALAARWNVSLLSIILRAAELGAMNDANKRYYIGAANRGAGEEVHIRAQKPRFYRQMCEVLFGKPISLATLARRTGASRTFLNDVLKAHSGKAEDMEPLTPSSSSPNASELLFERSPNVAPGTA